MNKYEYEELAQSLTRRHWKTIDQQLYDACSNGRTEEVRQLLAHPIINPNCEDPSGQTPFWTACFNGQIEVVKLLLNDERVLTNKADWNLRTPLYIACEKGHIEIVKLLLNDEKIDVNKTDKANATPLYIACSFRYVDIVELLLNDERTDINEANYDDQTPFWIACQTGRTDILKLLLTDERIDINKKNQGKMKQEVKKQTTNIGTPLLIACRHDVKIVQYILASGKEINLNEKDNKGNTVIGLKRKEIEDIEQQVQQIQSFKYDPAPLEASKKKQIEIIELLESFERNPNETRTNLRNQLGLPDINFADGNKRKKRRKIDDEKKVVVEERKSQELKRPEYEIEYNRELFVLQTTAKALPEFEIAIKSKLQLEQNEKIKLHFKRKGFYFVLDDFESLQYGMRIKVSMISKHQPNPGNQIEHFQLKNWNDIVFLSQGANNEYRIEIDPDEIPSQLKNQIVGLMEKCSKLETCLKFQTTIHSNIIFQIDFQTGVRAEKVFEQIVDILESN